MPYYFFDTVTSKTLVHPRMPAYEAVKEIASGQAFVTRSFNRWKWKEPAGSKSLGENICSVLSAFSLNGVLQALTNKPNSHPF